MKMLSILAVILILSTVQFGCGKEQDKEQDIIVISYLKALDSGKIDEAVSYYSKSAMLELEKAGGKQPLASAFQDAFSKRKGINTIKITKKEITGDTAKITFLYKFNDGSSDKGILLLVKEDGKWKILK
jgi:ketosteroid isomerase-like protein